MLTLNSKTLTNVKNVYNKAHQLATRSNPSGEPSYGEYGKFILAADVHMTVQELEEQHITNATVDNYTETELLNYPPFYNRRSTYTAEGDNLSAWKSLGNQEYYTTMYNDPVRTTGGGLPHGRGKSFLEQLKTEKNLVTKLDVFDVITKAYEHKSERAEAKKDFLKGDEYYLNVATELVSSFDSTLQCDWETLTGGEGLAEVARRRLGFQRVNLVLAFLQHHALHVLELDATDIIGKAQQLPGQSAEKYVLHLKSISSLVALLGEPVDGSQVWKRFMKGLHEHYKHEARRENLNVLDYNPSRDLVDLARKVDTAVAATAKPSTTKKWDDVKDTPTGKESWKRRKMSKDETKTQDIKVGNGGSNGSRHKEKKAPFKKGFNSKDKDKKPAGVLPADQRDKAFKKGLCFHCMQPGHRSFQCPTKEKQDTDQKEPVAAVVEHEPSTQEADAFLARLSESALSDAAEFFYRRAE